MKVSAFVVAGALAAVAILEGCGGESEIPEEVQAQLSFWPKPAISLPLWNCGPSKTLSLDRFITIQDCIVVNQPSRAWQTVTIFSSSSGRDVPDVDLAIDQSSVKDGAISPDVFCFGRVARGGSGACYGPTRSAELIGTRVGQQEVLSVTRFDGTGTFTYVSSRSPVRTITGHY